MAVFLTAVPCSFSCLLFRHAESRNSDTPPWLLRGGEVSLWLVPLAVALACLTVGLVGVARHLARRAATPLPPPAPDPLATYREGSPLECPHHPFAR